MTRTTRSRRLPSAAVSRHRTAAVALVALLTLGGCQWVGPVGGRTASFHGDSMGAQADGQITERLSRTYRFFRYSQERATIATMLPVIERLMNERPPEIVIIELGSGDAYTWRTDAQLRADIRRVLTLVRPADCVRWLSLKIGGVNGFYEGYVARADDVNRILRAKIARTPTTKNTMAPYQR